MRRKRRSLNQIQEETSYSILRSKLPESWVIHEYGPDYGIDYVVELFDYVDEQKNIAETLGENFFVQLKSSSTVNYTSKRIYSRRNVEKGVLTENKSEYYDIDVASFQLETSELLTVQSMGVAIPVLLILVDVNTSQTYFVCLNDYIDKVLLPTDRNYQDKQSKTIYIPIKNEILNDKQNLIPLRVYGKRSKMYGAFNKFYYQKNEISQAVKIANLYINSADEYEKYIFEAIQMISTFIETALRLDIWCSHEFWQPVMGYSHELILMKSRLESAATLDDYEQILNRCSLDIWPRLANLGNVYEEIVREWFMPAYLGE